MQDCIFCKIIRGEIPSTKHLETSNFIVFEDIHPSAPLHLLIVPKKHIKDITEADLTTWDEIRQVALELAKQKNITGFRLINNMGEAALVQHLHVHFLSGIKKDRKV